MKDNKEEQIIICANCKKSIKNSGYYCPECGNPIKSKDVETDNNQYSKPKIYNSTLSIIGFICAICGIVTCGISSIPGLIISIIASNESSKKGYKDSLATAGVIISAIILSLFVVIVRNNGSLNSGRYTLVESHISNKSNQYYTYIDGSIKNNRNIDLSYIQVTFTVYDNNGNTVGTCMANNSGLDANGTWYFSAICSEGNNRVSKYKLKSISGW